MFIRLPLLLVIFATSLLAEDRAPIKIGVLAPFSGSFAQMGEDIKNGALLAADLYPTLKVQLIFGDSKADPNTALSEFRKLTTQDNIAALYVVRSGVGLALNPLSKAAKLPLMGGVAHDDFTKQNEYAFQVWSTARQEGELLADDVHSEHGKKLALFDTSDDYMLAVARGFREHAADVGINIVSDMEFPPDTTDFRSFILKARSTEADSIFANLTMAHLGTFLKQLQESGIKAKVFSNFMVSKEDVISTAGPLAVKGIRYVSPSTDYPKAIAALKARTTSAGFNALTLSSYTGIALALQALAENKSIKTSVDLYSAMIKITELKLPDRNLQVADRQVKYPMAVTELP